MPIERISDSTGRGVLWVIVICALTIVILNCFARAYLQRYPINKGYQIVEHKWSLLRAAQTPVDTLLVGDSSCNQGIEPILLGNLLGGEALNLCTIADALVVEDAWMIHEYLEHVGRPRRLIVAHVHDVWYRDTTTLRTFSWLMSGSPDFFHSARPRISMTWNDLLTVSLGRYIPLLNQEASLRSILLSPRKHLFRAARTDFTPQGFMPVATADPVQAQRDVVRHLDTARTRIPSISIENELALREIIKLCKEHEIDLFFAPAPVADRLWAHPSFRAYYLKLQAMLAQKIEAFGDARLLSSTPPTFPLEVMQNADHLVGSAADAYTRWLADAITAAQP